MFLRYGLLADAVVRGDGGKFHIIGMFNCIGAPVFPCIHPSLSMAVRIEGDPSEVGGHDFELGFVDADYKSVAPPFTGRFELRKEDFLLTGIFAEFTVSVENLAIPAAGRYEFFLSVDKRHLGSIPLSAVLSTAL